MRLQVHAERLASGLLLSHSSLTVFLVIGLAAGLEAQATAPAPEASEPLLEWNPTLTLNGIGYDSNIFNEAEQPKGDMMMAFGAGLRPVWRPPSATLSADAAVSYRYFHEYASERGFDGRARGQIDVPLAQTRLFAAGSYVNVRERLNYEVDQRARRAEHNVGGGAEVSLGGHLSAVVRVDRYGLDYDDGAMALAATLNRDRQAAAVELHHALTPLTTLEVQAEWAWNRFETATERDGRETSIGTGLAFGRGALIEGRWSIGWQRVTVEDPLQPVYTGFDADANLWTVVGAATRLGVTARRGLTFSADVASPYYTESAIGGSVTYGFRDRWEFDARGDLVRLDHSAGLQPSAAGYTERVGVLGLGLGFRVTDQVRVGVGVQSVRRRNPVDDSRSYDTTRVVVGLSQPLGIEP
jgi:hypothetical protein